MVLSKYLPGCLLIMHLVVTSAAQSQKTETYNYAPNEVATIHSNVLNEDRKIYVHCPKVDSADLDKRFPVLYVLDGDNHFELLAQYVDYLSRPDVREVPKTIIVGITNTKRTRDLTPTNSTLNYFGKPDAIYSSSGGNENFLQFITTDLIPFIDKNYKTSPYKIFAGHSFGGLASINCLLLHPDMLDAYVAVSPSLWWDNRYLLKLANQKLKKAGVLNKKFFYSNGNEGLGYPTSFRTDLLKLDSLLTSKNLSGLNRMYKNYPTETHMTEPIVAYYDALRFIFKDWEKEH